jgi:hypothetical protein
MVSREALGSTVAPAIMDKLEPILTFEHCDLAIRMDRNVRQRFNTTDQIA